MDTVTAVSKYSLSLLRRQLPQRGSHKVFFFDEGSHILILKK